MPVKTFTFDEMEAIVRRARPMIAGRLAHRICLNEEKIFNLGIERARTIGVKQYGDSSFHLPLHQVKIEVDDELADANFWEGIYVAKDLGWIV